MASVGGMIPQSTQFKNSRLTPSNTISPIVEYPEILSVDHKTSIIVNRTLTIKIRYSYPDSSLSSLTNQVLEIESRTFTLSIWRTYGGGTQMVVKGTLEYKAIFPTLGEWTIKVNDFGPTTVIVEERKIGLLIALTSLSVLLGIGVLLFIFRKKIFSK